MRRQAMSEQQRGPTPEQMLMMAALNRRGIYPTLEHEETNLEILNDRELIQWYQNRALVRNPNLKTLHLDLYIKEKALDIEIDGSSHKHREAKDEERDLYLLSVGIKTSRWTNSQVKMDADAIAGLVWAMM